MPKKDIILTGAELLVIVVALFIAVNYIVRHNINNNKNGELSGETIKVYALSENPQFEISPQQIGVNSKDIDVKVEHSTGLPVDVTVNKTKKANGDYEVTLEHSEKFRPGKYIMIVTGDEATLYDDFYWGVLAVNTNKSVYAPNEEAFLQLGVLDQWGHTLCDANIKLEVTDPKNKTQTLEVNNSPSCGRDNVVDAADYTAYYKNGGAGTYTITLTNLNNNFVLATQFKVEANPAFSVERIGAMRINPFKVDSYLMTIKIKASKDFSGTVEEYTPKSFKIDGKEANKVSWDVNLSAGEEKVLTYKYTAPLLSPQFYLIGPLRILSSGVEVFRESRAWQIASDTAYTSIASGSWDATGTWSVAGTPTAGDIVTLSANHTITVGSASSALSVIFAQSGATLAVTAGNTLVVTSGIVLNNIAGGSNWASISGPGTINVATVQVGNYAVPTVATQPQCRMILNLANLNIGSDMIITSHSGSAATMVSSAYVDLQTGSVNVVSIKSARPNTCTFCSAGITMNTGGQSGVLTISGSNPWQYAAMTHRYTLTGTTAVVSYKASAYQTLPLSSANTYTTLRINNTAGVAFTGSATTTNLSIGDQTASSILIDSGFQLYATGTLTFTSGTYKLGGAASTTWPGFVTNTISAGTTVQYQSAAAQTVSITPTYSNLTFSGAGIKTTSTGTLTVTSTWAVNSPTTLKTNNTIVSASEFTGSGAVTQGTGNISLNGNWLNTGAFVTGSAAVIMTGTSKIISGPSGGFTLRGLQVNGTVTNAYGSGGIITITSALSGAGTLIQNSAPTTLTIKGNAIITNLIASAPGNSVIFSGTNQSITGSYSFYNLSLTGTATRTVTFTGNTTTKVAAGGSFTSTGAQGNLISLSSSDINKWIFQVDPTASVSVSYTKAQNSNATGYKQILAPLCLGNVDGGGNTNWFFPDCTGTMNLNGINIQGVNFVKP